MIKTYADEEVGNGGFAGVIDEDALMENLNIGFAVAGGDSGHRAVDNNDGNGAPGVYLPFLHDVNQTSAWIHNSIAYFTPPAQALVQDYYGQAPNFSYYKGCSTGGAQGFALAQFYPDMFHGIIAGSPGNWYSHLSLSFLWGYHVNQTLVSTLNHPFRPGHGALLKRTFRQHRGVQSPRTISISFPVRWNRNATSSTAFRTD